MEECVFIYGFWIFASSILMVLVILLENDFFKLAIYLDIYFFVCGDFARLKCWRISLKDSKFIEAFILRRLLITYANKISKIHLSKIT